MNSPSHVFVRLILLAASGFLLAFAVYMIVSGKQIVGETGIPMPAVASIFLGIVSVILGCGGVWISLFAFANARTLKELDEEAVWGADDRPKIPRNAIACRWSFGSKAGGIFIDTGADLIHFQNCHTRRGFLTSTEEWFSCPISDVMRVHSAHVYKVGMCLTIVTNVGGVRVPKNLVDYSELHTALVKLVPRNDPGFLMHDPAFHFIIGFFIAGCGFLGIFLGWWLLPLQATDTRLAIYLMVGATLGIVGSLLLTVLADRTLQERSRKPTAR